MMNDFNKVKFTLKQQTDTAIAAMKWKEYAEYR